MSAPILAVGDGALGFCAALREVVPDYGAKWPKAIAKITDNVEGSLVPAAIAHALADSRTQYLTVARQAHLVEDLRAGPVSPGEWGEVTSCGE
ncbi:MAG TPA: hypothetical protein VK735_30235 [Pseudonocardia sp.]|uniref:hypothetical protein n=1 Tax=Pseudonocardia sp. TaxID=60912 RepID=UPI002CBFF196|nr:hypothetical protein [Pseudonocardia sp.]HTF51745.1 hypothetical protein [Pseudonocardia sp.]